MKFYMWSRVKCLESYAPGTAYALAESVDDAIKLIVKAYIQDSTASSIIDTGRELFKELKQTEPNIYDSPQGFYQYGSM